MHDAEITAGILAGLGKGESPNGLARRLAAHAYEASLAKSGSTPYSLARSVRLPGRPAARPSVDTTGAQGRALPALGLPMPKRGRKQT